MGRAEVKAEVWEEEEAWDVVEVWGGRSRWKLYLPKLWAKSTTSGRYTMCSNKVSQLWYSYGEGIKW